MESQKAIVKIGPNPLNRKSLNSIRNTKVVKTINPLSKPLHCRTSTMMKPPKKIIPKTFIDYLPSKTKRKPKTKKSLERKVKSQCENMNSVFNDITVE